MVKAVILTESTLQNGFSTKNVVVLVLGDLRKFGTPAKVRHFRFGVLAVYCQRPSALSPAGGIEPPTNRLTVYCSTAELSRNVILLGIKASIVH